MDRDRLHDELRQRSHDPATLAALRARGWQVAIVTVHSENNGTFAFEFRKGGVSLPIRPLHIFTHPVLPATYSTFFEPFGTDEIRQIWQKQWAHTQQLPDPPEAWDGAFHLAVNNLAIGDRFAIQCTPDPMPATTVTIEALGPTIRFVGIQNAWTEYEIR